MSPSLHLRKIGDVTEQADDDQGKQYIDGLAGVFVVSVGHSNASIIEAIMDQVQRLSFVPPLTITFEQIDDLVGRLKLAIGDILNAS